MRLLSKPKWPVKGGGGGRVLCDQKGCGQVVRGDQRGCGHVVRVWSCGEGDQRGCHHVVRVIREGAIMW